MIGDVRHLCHPYAQTVFGVRVPGLRAAFEAAAARRPPEGKRLRVVLPAVMNARNRVIAALDMPTEAQARAVVEALGNPAQHDKIGLPRLCAASPARAGVEGAGAHGGHQPARRRLA